MTTHFCLLVSDNHALEPDGNLHFLLLGDRLSDLRKGVRNHSVPSIVSNLLASNKLTQT